MGTGWEGAGAGRPAGLHRFLPCPLLSPLRPGARVCPSARSRWLCRETRTQASSLEAEGSGQSPPWRPEGVRADLGCGDGVGTPGGTRGGEATRGLFPGTAASRSPCPAVSTPAGETEAPATGPGHIPSAMRRLLTARQGPVVRFPSCPFGLASPLLPLWTSNSRCAVYTNQCLEKESQCLDAASPPPPIPHPARALASSLQKGKELSLNSVCKAPSTAVSKHYSI